MSKKYSTLWECFVENNELVQKIKHFSILLKLLRTIAWMKCFISKARKLSMDDGFLCATRIKEAEKLNSDNSKASLYIEIH